MTSSAPSSAKYDGNGGYTYPSAASSTVNGVTTTTTNTASLPQLATNVDTHNQLRIRVLKQRTVTCQSGGDTAPRGQLAVDMSIPYAKKVNYERDGTSAVPMTRDIAVLVTPIAADLPRPAALGAEYAHNDKSAGYCYISSEFFFKDP